MKMSLRAAAPPAPGHRDPHRRFVSGVSRFRGRGEEKTERRSGSADGTEGDMRSQRPSRNGIAGSGHRGHARERLQGLQLQSRTDRSKSRRRRQLADDAVHAGSSQDLRLPWHRFAGAQHARTQSPRRAGDRHHRCEQPDAHGVPDDDLDARSLGIAEGQRAAATAHRGQRPERRRRSRDRHLRPVAGLRASAVARKRAGRHGRRWRFGAYSDAGRPRRQHLRRWPHLLRRRHDEPQLPRDRSLQSEGAEAHRDVRHEDARRSQATGFRSARMAIARTS